MLLYLLLYFTCVLRLHEYTLNNRDEHCSYCKGWCAMCLPGYYGEHCHKRCPPFGENMGCDCQNGRCRTDAAVYKKTSWSCNCMSCSGDCSSCVPGWYGANCTLQCLNCSVHGCSKETGICKVCADGYHGHDCDHPCPKNCRSICHRYTKTCLDGCKRGWWGDHCHAKCSEGCLEKLCTFDGERCLVDGCVDGYEGKLCKRKYVTATCNPIYCIKQACKHDGTCSEGCVNGRYGDACDNTCSIYCIKQACTDNGTCSEGCVNGRYGDACDNTCSIYCIKQTCKHDGTCSEGCLSGWFGRFCTQPLPTNTDYMTRPEILMIVCAIIIIAGVVVVSCLFRKNKHWLTREGSQSLTSMTSSQHYDVIDDNGLNSVLENETESNPRAVPLLYPE